MGNKQVSHVRRLLHWGPILALTVISVISICGITCSLQWWPVNNIGGFLNMAVYLFWNVTTLYNFFNAAFVGPGHMPSGWKPEGDEDLQRVQYCIFCKGYKGPRSHHCRKCDRCVMKMDHHCPWINNCVGHFNHGYFTYFLFYAPCGCIHSICVLIPAMYRALNRHYYILYGTGEEPIVQLGINHFICCMFAVGLAVGVVIAVGGLLFIQVRAILKNESGIESWIIEKAQYRQREEDEPEFVFPYNHGRWENWRQVFSFKQNPKMDGIWWPVVDGCNQFTLTEEQIKQKREKKDRSVVYKIKEGYSGAIFPCTKGCRVCCCPPCSDESRIPLVVGDHVLVSRWKKHWLYGDKMGVEKGGDGDVAPCSRCCHHECRDVLGEARVRGWFPRRCAIEVMENGHMLQQSEKDEEDKKQE